MGTNICWQIELDQLNRTQLELKQGSEKLEDILQKLEKEQVKRKSCFETFKHPLNVMIMNYVILVVQNVGNFMPQGFAINLSFCSARIGNSSVRTLTLNDWSLVISFFRSQSKCRIFSRNFTRMLSFRSSCCGSCYHLQFVSAWSSKLEGPA